MKDGKLDVNFTLPGRAVALLVLEWKWAQHLPAVWIFKKIGYGCVFRTMSNLHADKE